MSIFKRIFSIWRSRKEPQPSPASIVPTLESVNVGDIVTVDLEEYLVTGKVAYSDHGYAPHRFAYYLQSGQEIRCLLVEKGRTYDCFICTFMEGGLDDPNDVPTTLVVDGEKTFTLENEQTDRTTTFGNTDFRTGDELKIWRYFTNEVEHLFLQWQSGKFVAMNGMRVPSGEVKIMKSKQQ
ncbi:MAG: hypothetical protein K0Q59_2476 [Paenibacillus sp.]|jgi:hypothetical protein|nr:hypothetical protein [Paenibacillus sp.]